MKTKLILTVTGCAFVILLSFGYIFFYKIETEPISEIISENQTLLQNQPQSQGQASIPADKPGLPTKKRPGKNKKPDLKKDIRPDTLLTVERATTPETVDLPQHVEKIKNEIYALNIEYAEQIEQLDDLVQTGDTDTREFWGNEWNSVDDWKKKANGFRLEKNKDGTLVFTPDEQTARSYTFFENPLAYTYDAENKEFVNEIDYYGKTIYNVAKFISDDVLVMMTISGRKVDLNIYHKNAAQP